MDPAGRPIKVCIIGAGPSGLFTLFRFLQLEDPIPEVVCYDKQSTWGGQWNYSWRTVMYDGTDKFGEPIQSSVYNNLWTNNPRETIELPHFTFEEHFGRAIPSFVSHSVVRDYVGGLFKISKHNMEDRIKYNTSVRNVHYNDTTDDFTVLVTDLPTKRMYRETFSHVIVATGIYTTSFVPDIEGIDKFPGLILHSQYIKRSEVFRGRRVLLIGSSYSAVDLAAHCQKYGADHVIISYRRNAVGYDWPDKIEERPMVTRFTRNRVEFMNGTCADVDITVFCTGYIYNHPFLEENLRVDELQTSLYPSHLYRGIVWQNGGNQRLLYIGIPTLLFSLPTFDVQAVWIVAYITGKIPLEKPERAPNISLAENRRDMDEEIRIMREKFRLARTNGDRMVFVTQYIQSIADEIGYKVDVSQYATIAIESRRQRAISLMTYRDLQYTSVYTGNLAPKTKIPWIENFNDDLESFMKSF